MAEYRLKSARFRQERQESWQELEALLTRLERRGARRLSGEDLARLPVLYRSAASSLSVARAVSLDRNLLLYLENLVGRAYLAVYARPHSAWSAIVDFFRRAFPDAVRRSAGLLLLSALLMAAGGLTGGLLVLAEEERYYSLVPEAMAQGRNPASSTEELRAVLFSDAGEADDADDAGDPDAGAEGEESGSADEEDDEEEGLRIPLELFASFLFTHNAKIGIVCFALGFAAGAPTAFLLFYNGLMLGAMGALYHSRGLSLEFWGWVLPHGVTELLAVLLCGMAGLAIGHALVFPGRLSRLDRLARVGREQALVVVGCVGMFFVAALFEGFFRQLVDSTAVRWTVAGAVALCWAAYFGLCGRGRPAPVDPHAG